MEKSKEIEVLWAQFSSALRSFIYSKVKNSADTEDILQNVFVKIHNNICSLKDDSKIKSWIYQIARNLIIDYFRNSNRTREGELILEEFASSSTSNESMNEAISDMIKMMDSLPQEYCEALCLVEIEGVSQKEFAEKKGISYSGAKSRVQRARSMLKDMLLNCCHYQFDKYGTVFDIQPKCCCCEH